MTKVCAYPVAIQEHCVCEIEEIQVVFDKIAKDGKITPEEHMGFDALITHHYYTAEEIKLISKQQVYFTRTGKAQSPWHERLQKSLERQRAQAVTAAQAR